MVMRWYKNEDRGWMHDSTVELVKAERHPVRTLMRVAAL